MEAIASGVVIQALRDIGPRQRGHSRTSTENTLAINWAQQRRFVSGGGCVGAAGARPSRGRLLGKDDMAFKRCRDCQSAGREIRYDEMGWPCHGEPRRLVPSRGDCVTGFRQSDLRHETKLLELARSKEPAARQRGFEWLHATGVGTVDRLPVLVAGLNDSDALVRMFALACLRRLNHREMAERVVELVDCDPNPDVRRVLGQTRDDALELLARNLPEAGTEEVEFFLELAKKQRAKMAALAPIAQRAVASWPVEHRRRWLPILASIGVEGVSGLIASLSDSDAMARRVAAQSLGGLGRVARSALPALKELAADPDEDVREAAQAAIFEIAR